MTVCEHLRFLGPAAEFAQAAAHEIVLLKESAPEDFQEELAAREGRVWSNLFTYALDSQQYEVGLHPSAVLHGFHASCKSKELSLAQL